MLAVHVSDKGLISKICIAKKKNPFNSIIKRQLNLKMVKDINRRFSKVDVKRANNHMKRCSTLLVVRETQIKTTMKYHFTQTTVARIQKSETNKCYQWTSSG